MTRQQRRKQNPGAAKVSEFDIACLDLVLEICKRDENKAHAFKMAERIINGEVLFVNHGPMK